MPIKRTILKKDKNIFIVKLNLDAGEVIPEHNSSAHVTVAVISGLGVFTINNNAKAISKGDFIDMKPLDNHSISANEDLELIVHHITFNIDSKTNSEHVCGLNNI